MRADLHVHTACSDGTLTPGEIVQAAQGLGLEVLALTDHDTLAGADALAGRPLPFRLIAGVELSLRDMPGLHLLGYGAGAAAGPLRAELARLAQARAQRAEEMLRRLRALGLAVSLPPAAPGHTLGRAHIARALVAAGYAATVGEAFDRYLGEGRPAYIPGERLGLAQALALLHRCRMTPVLAHPALLPVEPTALPALLRRWRDQGLEGVEVYHPAQAGRGFAALDRQARRLGLLVTGGSDFHERTGQRHAQLGAMIPLWPGADRDVSALLARMDKDEACMERREGCVFQW